MLYDYRQESKTPMLLTLANGNTIEGEFINLRIETDTLPKGKLWYHIRHTDDDWTEPASLKNGCVVVNFCGTFICAPHQRFPLWTGTGYNRLVISGMMTGFRRMAARRIFLYVAILLLTDMPYVAIDICNPGLLKQA